MPDRKKKFRKRLGGKVRVLIIYVLLILKGLYRCNFSDERFVIHICMVDI